MFPKEEPHVFVGSQCWEYIAPITKYHCLGSATQGTVILVLHLRMAVPAEGKVEREGGVKVLKQGKGC